MPDLFGGLFDTASISLWSFLLCVGVSLLAGLLLSLMTRWKSRSSESFCTTIALLPASVCVVIMMVNGNIGAGVAVAGAFSLVRFRSAAGTGREISAIFIAMGAGLMAGMGYLGYCVLFTLLLGGMMMVCTALHLGADRSITRTLRITIPENLSYADVFDPILNTFTKEYQLTSVKTTNMGSMFKLTYDIALRSHASEKDMIDALRCRNGNLEISLTLRDAAGSEL